jgi:hypothetical protein
VSRYFDREQVLCSAAADQKVGRPAGTPPAPQLGSVNFMGSVGEFFLLSDHFCHTSAILPPSILHTYSIHPHSIHTSSIHAPYILPPYSCHPSAILTPYFRHVLHAFLETTQLVDHFHGPLDYKVSVGGFFYFQDLYSVASTFGQQLK